MFNNSIWSSIIYVWYNLQTRIELYHTSHPLVKSLWNENFKQQREGFRVGERTVWWYEEFWSLIFILHSWVFYIFMQVLIIMERNFTAVIMKITFVFLHITLADIFSTISTLRYMSLVFHTVECCNNLIWKLSEILLEICGW